MSTEPESKIGCINGVSMDFRDPARWWRGEDRLPVSEEEAARAGWDVGLWKAERHKRYTSYRYGRDPVPHEPWPRKP
ncbi:hypothetical protein SAMN04515648_2956 [Phyllobacterium sp. CL33Tsu]|uniref:hypothetical protein n=1 Tax=Phyllobacterium sp. CL33Tsu TaxID=1798191 RepID=UPI0008E3750D|nr:hypothetical protein [Phyllobacterium sp. CL33Tsu]SFJ16492.1 hypothetical protein SAMN04515648_2956 [Phyllobacterium sp. CL33Tsu]